MPSSGLVRKLRKLHKPVLIAALSKDPFFWVSKCTGFTYISEDSSEITFLLVENYQLTALVGLRIGKEFLDNPQSLRDTLFISLASLDREALEKRLSNGLAKACVGKRVDKRLINEKIHTPCHGLA